MSNFTLRAQLVSPDPYIKTFLTIARSALYSPISSTRPQEFSPDLIIFASSLYSATPSSASSIISIINRVIPGRKTITLKMPRYPWSKYTNYTSLWRTLWYSRYVTRSYSTSLQAIFILPHTSFVITFLCVSQIGLIRLWFGLITNLAVAKEICHRQHHI